MPADEKDFRVAIFSPNRDAVSETFIKAHIELLPFVVLPQYGVELSVEDAAGRKVMFSSHAVSAFIRRVTPEFYSMVRDFLLARYLRRIRANAVLAEYGVTGSYLAPACNKAKVPLFVHFHGFDASVHDVLADHRDSYRRMFEIAEGIVVVSHAMKEKLICMGAREERVHLNYYGVDPTCFDHAKPEEVGPHFIAVGRFVEKKAPHLTILAFAKALQAVPEATLTMIGEGPLLGICKQLVLALGLGASVKLLGIRSPDEVSRHMRQARAFVQHSIVAENGDSEGTPVAIIEAHMSGLPVAATRHAGIPDVVVDGETGFLVEEADLEGMAAAMIKLARDSELAARLGTTARQRAVKYFSIDCQIAQLAAIIKGGRSNRQ